MREVDTIRQHLIGSSIHEPDECLEITVKDYRCAAEHYLEGSTHTLVNNPWIPYAILAGKPVTEVNLKRLEKKEYAVLSVFFSLPGIYLAYCNYELVCLDTLEIPLPEIARVIHRETRQPIPKIFWENAVYRGKYTKG